MTIPWRSSRSSASARRSVALGEERRCERPAPLCRRGGRTPRAREAPPGRDQLEAARIDATPAAASTSRSSPLPPTRAPRARRGRPPATRPAASTRSAQKSARSAEGCADRGRRLALGRRLRRRRPEERRVVAEVHGDAVETCADPHDLARRAQHVEIGRAGIAGTRRGSTSLSQSVAGSATPCSGTSASRSPCRRPMPCQEGRKRPKAACSAGSTSRRSTASVARRIRRSTSVSHHSRSEPPGRSSPRTSSSARSSAESPPSTRASSRSNRAASSDVVNGPCVRAYRRSSFRSASSTGSRNTCGTPPGGATPKRRERGRHPRSRRAARARRGGPEPHGARG